MTLLERQHFFSRIHPRLLDHIHASGYEVSQKHLLRCEDCKVGHPQSAHKVGLAVDLVLFFNGSLVESNLLYGKMHDYWDSVGGSPRIEGDLGHFSLEWGGVR